eukprot:CAMPEP_0202958710 /NCGR_PEP_ID=MMETSP1396-20130829/2983_1 /ASSEMBLY_ACC=CAM_ASM_000872 /TAXON_ID= /ORGANISM="Pseudokeronopsis sp., Strain Brazil" /LENGTH=102 /DNA_ID=CAMNT_0049676901 /DNA_START=324 /DNA_END=632 /DNA_ORIENTATION=+
MHFPMQSQPDFAKKTDYFKEYWKMYLLNETLIMEIERTSTDNYRMLKKCYNLEDYYENNLVPQMLAMPNKFINRLKLQQQQKALQVQRQQQIKQEEATAAAL